MQELITMTANANEAPAIIEAMRIASYDLAELSVYPHHDNHVILSFKYRK